MNGPAANPERLLLALDQRLDHPVRLIIYGRSAIWLGFENPPPATGATEDVDGIIPSGEVKALSDDMQFWDARDAVNEQFKSIGLYITHLFSEEQVFLRQRWLMDIVPITRLSLKRVRLFRPATIDLVLTKMMRGNDEEDMADAGFMIRHDRITPNKLLEAFSELRPIELVELREAFERAKPVVLRLAQTSEVNGS